MREEATLRSLPDAAGAGGEPLLAYQARLRLEARFQEAADRLRNHRSDSTLRPIWGPARLKAALEAADILQNDIHYRLSELRNLEGAGHLAAWETLHERTEKSLFGLKRFFGHAEALKVPLDLGGATAATSGSGDTL